MDWNRKGDNWVAPYYLDGTAHSRHDKLVAYMRDGRIYLHEQGGDTMNFYQWLLDYGGCSDNSEVNRVLSGSITPSFSSTPIIKPDLPSKFVPVEDVEKLEKRYWGELYLYLCQVFDPKMVREAWRIFHIGVLYNEITYWYRDPYGNFVYDNRISYHPNGHRIREICPQRKFLKRDGYNKGGIFYPDAGNYKKTICVESEKTAVICSIAYPDFKFIAVGGLNKVHAVKGLDVVLAPDMHPEAISKWKTTGNRIWEWWKGEDILENEDIGDLIIKKHSK